MAVVIPVVTKSKSATTTTTTTTAIVSRLPEINNDDASKSQSWTNSATDKALVVPSSASSTTSDTSSDDSSLEDDTVTTITTTTTTTDVTSRSSVIVPNNINSKLTFNNNSTSVRKRRAATTWRNTVFEIGISLLVWPGIIIVPLVLSSPYSPISFRDIFSKEMYENDDSTTSQYPKPLGIVLGLSSIVIGQTLMVLFFLLYKTYGNPIPVQAKGDTKYPFWQGVYEHFAQPKPVILLTTFLVGTWFYRILPTSYYNFNGTIQYHYVFICLLLQDFVQYCMHRFVHSAHAKLYRFSHKRHHTYINPILFDTFKGTLSDSILTVLVPLLCTTQLMRNCNVWTYMTFGSLDFNGGTFIHSEYILPWDNLIFEKLKFGTAADHHVHHIFFNYNYGHLFMYWDILFGTYRSPKSFGSKTFNLQEYETSKITPVST